MPDVRRDAGGGGEDVAAGGEVWLSVHVSDLAGHCSFAKKFLFRNGRCGKFP